MAIDAGTGDFYVFDTDSTAGSPGAYVEKFDSLGNPIPSFGTAGKIDGSESPSGAFLEYGEGSVLGLPVGLPLQIAVDNDPTSPSYQDVYVADIEHEVVDKFDSSGNYLSHLAAPIVSGISVDPANGDVYTVSLFGTVEVWDASGGQLSSFATEEGFGLKPHGIAADSSGNAYVTNGEETKVYDSSGVFVKALDPNPSFGVAVDPADDHVYVDERNRVVEFDTTGTQAGEAIGSDVLSNSVSLGVNAGRMVVTNGGIGKVSLFGAPSTPPERGYDSPLVIDSVREAGTPHGDEFQLTPSGKDAVFISTLPLSGFDSADKEEVFRYDTTAGLECISCSPTTVRPESDATLTPSGSSLTEDGRVFFTTAEPLTLRDTNEKRDVYEWEDGALQLISTGTSSDDSSLLSVSADGENAFFFTRQKLVPEDENGSSVRLYTAREHGGFAFGPPQFQCAASDECHGASTAPAPPLAAGTTAGTPGQFSEEKSAKCAKGKVKRRGKCASRHPHKRHGHKRAAKTTRGGAK